MTLKLQKFLLLPHKTIIFVIINHNMLTLIINHSMLTLFSKSMNLFFFQCGPIIPLCYGDGFPLEHGCKLADESCSKRIKFVKIL